MRLVGELSYLDCLQYCCVLNLDWFSPISLECDKWRLFRDKAGIFWAILGRGPRAFLIGKISDVKPEFGKFSEYLKLIMFSKLTQLIKLMHLESLIIA